MPNQLRDAVSPYLRSHADNPVDWFPWSEAAFAEARARDVPVLVSIGYSTCHWCHVMARESFSDPQLAAYLNANFVAIKVDREEHPDVDASYLAAAGAFTSNLGWPLNVFVTPEGRAFFAGTYFPPVALPEHPSFRQALAAVTDAWTERRADVEQNAATIAQALAAPVVSAGGSLPTVDQLDAAVAELIEYEDAEFGGFGGAPKFPVAPALLFLLERAASGGAEALALADRTLTLMAASDLRDPVEGGFFRYATLRDWSDPHYERMLYDNALLLQAYTRLEQLGGSGRAIAEGIADFLLGVLRLPGGGFASAQDSESTVDGQRVEGGYYRLDSAARAAQTPPALDEKVLTGWNGLAIEALALAGTVFSRSDLVAAAGAAADYLIERHIQPDGTLLRASIGDRVSEARATLEDFGMLSGGLLQLAISSGEVRYAEVARRLVDGSIAAAGSDGAAFGVPGGADPVLSGQGLAIESDPSEGAYPSGISSMAAASNRLHLLTADSRYREASTRAIARVAALAVPRPVSFGMTLAVASTLLAPIGQLVVVTDVPDAAIATPAQRWYRGGATSVIVTREQAAGFAAAGFELFEGRDREAAYLCEDFVCRLPVTDAAELEALLA
ncbi:thioredoxin domain-containing protein [soil metagenome]